MIYAVIQDDRIISVKSGDPKRAGVTLYAELPPTHQVVPGTPRNWYTSEWSLRPLIDLVNEGLADPPDGMIYDPEINDWRTGLPEELYVEGRYDLGDREIFDGTNIRGMTQQELFDRGLLSPEEVNKFEKSELSIKLKELDRAATRSLRAILAGTATQADHDRLAEIEAAASELRAKLSALGG